VKRLVLLAAVSMLLAACVSVPRARAPQSSALIEQADLPAAFIEAQRARSEWLHEREHWAFQGRAAISQGRDGGNVRIDWQQEDRRNYRVELIAPVTKQSWRLFGNTHYESGRLEGLEGGPRGGEDAETLLYAATGWYIPVNLLPDWVRGLAAADAAAPQRVAYDTSGRIRLIEQMGWRIEYQEWHPAADTCPTLPKRIEARSFGADHGEARVRLLLDRWDISCDGPDGT
jgi:outer membrane lipoprotein LolB